MILVTGATGNIGARVVACLCERRVPVRAFVRDAARAAARLGSHVELAVGDFEDAPSIRRALRGADALLLSSTNHPRQAEHEIAVIDAAAESGVRRVVKLSTVGARVGSALAFWEHHGRAEEHLRRSELPATILQSSFYMTNLLASADQVREQGALYAPAAGARLALTHPSDVADVAVSALVTGGHEGRTLTVTGPVALTYEQIADELSRATGRQVSFVAVPDDAAHSAFLASGMPPWFAQQLITLCGFLRQGAAAETTDAVRDITGHQPRTLRQFAHEHRGSFAAPPPTSADAAAPAPPPASATS
jgi:uncharacterized protein YbjT (DUF2867 family)